MVDKTENDSKKMAHYDLVSYAPPPENQQNKNPFQWLIDSKDKTKILNFLNTHVIGAEPLLNSKDYDEALKYLIPKELKPGESLSVKNNKKVSYEELVKVYKNVENVSQYDHASNKMPRIFVLQDPPPEKSRINSILDKIKGTNPLKTAMYDWDNDSIIIHKQFAADHTPNEMKATFAHEIGHRINFSTQGFITAKYNSERYVRSIVESPLGEKIRNDCAVDEKTPPYYRYSGIIDATIRSKLCAEDMKKIMPLIETAKSNTKEKNLELSHEREFKADTYATLAGYGDGFISFSLQQLSSDSHSHPSSDRRINRVKYIQENTEAAKQELEAPFKPFTNHILLSENADNGNKTPTPSPTLKPQGKER